jgi:adenylylsulfate kinase-like enzyme
MADAGLIVIASFISPFRAERQMAREMMGGVSCMLGFGNNLPVAAISARAA